MSRPCLEHRWGLELLFVLGASLGLLREIILEPQASANVVGSLLWALMLMGVIMLNSSETPVWAATDTDKRWFEHEGTLRGL